MATRVTPLRDQWRTAVTECSAESSVCAPSKETETASAAISFIGGYWVET